MKKTALVKEFAENLTNFIKATGIVEKDKLIEIMERALSEDEEMSENEKKQIREITLTLLEERTLK